MQNNELRKSRDNYIDVLKGIAIIFVVLIHFEQKWEAPFLLLNKIAKIGARAPQLFFIISAFLTWKSINRYGIGLRFFINRAKRLIPIYYLSLICAMLIPTITIKDYSIGNIIAHFLLLHGFHPLWINAFFAECDTGKYYCFLTYPAAFSDPNRCRVQRIISVACISFRI